MIRELRRAHRVLAGGLAIVPPALLAAALLTRPAGRATADLPGTPAGRGAPLVLGPDFPLDVTAAWDATTATLRFSVRARRALLAPDALLYWTPDEPRTDAELPDGSRFVAAVGASRAAAGAIADSGITRGGRLVLVTHPDRRLEASTPVLLPLPEGR